MNSLEADGRDYRCKAELIACYAALNAVWERWARERPGVTHEVITAFTFTLLRAADVLLRTPPDQPVLAEVRALFAGHLDADADPKLRKRHLMRRPFREAGQDFDGAMRNYDAVLDAVTAL